MTPLDLKTAADLLRGATIQSVEFVSDHDAEEGYVVLRAGGLTLYADAPTVYAADRGQS